MDKEDDAKLLAAVDVITARFPAGATYNRAREESRLPQARMSRAVTRLVKDGILEEVFLNIRVGSGAERKDVPGLQRKASADPFF